MVLPAYVGALDRKERRKIALITGASSGIGLDLAHLMAPDFDLIITARNQSELEKIARELEAAHGNRVHVVPADLTRPDAPQQIILEVERRGLIVDILINNAGFGAYGLFAASNLQSDMEMIQLNIAAYDAVKHSALPVVADAQVGLEALGQAMAGWSAPSVWTTKARQLAAEWNDAVTQATAPSNAAVPSDAQVLGAINRAAAR